MHLYTRVGLCLMSQISEKGTVHLYIYFDDILQVGGKEAIENAIKDIGQKI